VQDIYIEGKLIKTWRGHVKLDTDHGSILV